MNEAFEKLYRQLGRVTFSMLVAALMLYGLLLLFAVLGFSHAVASFEGIAASVGFVFCCLLGLFLLASVAAAVIRLLDRRCP